MYNRNLNNKVSIVLIFITIQKKDLSKNCKSDGTKDKKNQKKKASECCKQDAGDAFAEGLNDLSYPDISLNCSKELEGKVAKIYEVANTTIKSQMKGEKQLEDLTCSVDYINKKFDEHEEERKRKDKKIKCLQELVKRTKANMTLEQ